MSEAVEIIKESAKRLPPFEFCLGLFLIGVLLAAVFAVSTVMGAELNAAWALPIVALGFGIVGMLSAKSKTRAEIDAIKARLDALDGMDDEARYEALLPYLDRYKSENTASGDERDSHLAEMFAGELLEELVAIDDAEKRSEHVRAKVAAGGDNDSWLQLAALERYKCVKVGYKGDVRQLGGDWIDILRADYPKHEERKRIAETLPAKRRAVPDRAGETQVGDETKEMERA